MPFFVATGTKKDMTMVSQSIRSDAAHEVGITPTS